jgi:uncharacterized protein YyaL (SSP411 family)
MSRRACDPHGDFTGRNILAQARSARGTAKLHGLDPQAANDLLVSCLSRLLAARSARPRPHLDDKVVAGWNGLMISALARAAVVPAESLADRRAAYLAAALKAAAFVERELFDLPGGLPRRSWRRGEGSGAGFAEDCAFLVQAWLDLYEATFDAEVACPRGEVCSGRWTSSSGTPQKGGYFNSAAGAADVVVRLKEDYDGAEPAATSAAAMNLFRLSALTGDEACGSAAGARSLRSGDDGRRRRTRCPSCCARSSPRSSRRATWSSPAILRRRISQSWPPWSTRGSAPAATLVALDGSPGRGPGSVGALAMARADGRRRNKAHGLRLRGARLPGAGAHAG